MRKTVLVGTVLTLAALPAGIAGADTLRGSPSSMVHQHAIAVKEHYSFLRGPSDVTRLAEAGALVEVVENDNLALARVSYPFARPEVKEFAERFAAAYRLATGHRLVITSLTRPTALQPRNAHKLSVHPAGMAVDMRVPADSSGRAFIESALLEMERAGVLDVTRERQPPHYHVAVFADRYEPYASRNDSIAAVVLARLAARDKEEAAARGTTPVAAAKSDAAPLPLQEPGTGPGLLFGLIALVGMTAPVMFRRSAR